MHIREPNPSRVEIENRLRTYQRRTQQRDGFRRAAVLLPLYAREGEWQLLLTRRTAHLPHHQGQIAFPGGSVDTGEDCISAALREAQEEIALDPLQVDILGCHDDIWTPTGFIMSPVVGVLASLNGLHPNPVEVSRIFTVPLLFFAQEGNAESQTLVHDGVRRTVHFYRYAGETIWGATALIIRNFLLFMGLLTERSERGEG
ncbi:MAG: CoA pyrophosphatase [Bacteroidetes bacterium]|nr:CoA pyrophosphatase [Bacteroidota bacterium]